MKHITVRLAIPEDAGNILEWGKEHLESTEKLSYPTTKILCAENGKPIDYAYIHGVACIEGFAPNPEASNIELARSLQEILNQIVDMCKASGVKEIIAFAGQDDDKLIAFAKRNGFIELPYKALRLKI